MKFKDAVVAVADFPGNAVSSISRFFLGGTVKVPQETTVFFGSTFDSQTHSETRYKSKTKLGLFGHISNILERNKSLISAAAWISLGVAIGVGVTLALWPAALATVAGISIAGFSIAGLVGAGIISQASVAAAIAFVATSAAVLLPGAAVSALIWLKNKCCGPRAHKEFSVEKNAQILDPNNTIFNGGETLRPVTQKPDPSNEIVVTKTEQSAESESLLPRLNAK